MSALYNSIKEMNNIQGGLSSVGKFPKSKTPINLASVLDNNEAIHSMIGKSTQNAVGMMTNLMQRYFLYSVAQRELIARTRFNMSRDELESKMGTYLQLSVDIFKTNDETLVADMTTFITDCQARFALADSKYGDGDGLGKIVKGHVGQNKGQSHMGNNSGWFVNHVPDTDVMGVADGTISQIFRQTLERDEDGNMVRWHSDLKVAGVLPNSKFNVWVAMPSKEAIALAKSVMEDYGKGARGLGIGFKIELGTDEQSQLKSEWSDFLSDFRGQVVSRAKRLGISNKSLFDALWFNYTCKSEQQGDQSLPITLFPDEFLQMTTELVKDEFGEWVHPSFVGQTKNRTEMLPIMGILSQWTDYRGTNPVAKLLDGTTRTVELKCVNALKNGVNRVVSEIYLADDSEFEGLLIDGTPTVGHTSSIYEGMFNASFAWKAGKTGGSMMVCFEPLV